MKILVTGAAGFVGTHLVAALSPRNEVFGISIEKTPKNSANCQYFEGDILDLTSLVKILSDHRPEVIYHLAAKAAIVGSSVKSFVEVNTIGTLNIYEAVLSLKESGYNPKIIYISSAEVYGSTDHPEKITETAICKPVNAYGISKYAADRLSQEYAKLYGLNITVVRPFNHTGPGQNKGFFVPDMASQIVDLENSDRDEILVGNLQSVRDYSDVRDIVRAYVLLGEKETQKGEVFNICSGVGIKMEEVLDLLLRVSTKKIKIKIDDTRLRSSDTKIYVGDNTKIKNALGWYPEIPFEQTLKDTLDYWRGMRGS